MASNGLNNGIKIAELKDFAFQNGQSLQTAKIAYKVFNSNGQKTALIPTCFGGRIESTLNFTDGALKDYKVIVVAMFGNAESSSPSTTPDFPESLDYRDCVKAQYQLATEHLGLKSLDAVIGFSMGGQIAYYWAAMYPDFVKKSISICSSARTSKHNYQFLEGPKAALVNSVDYVMKDKAPESPKVTRGVHAFSKAYSAWLTSAQWFEEERYKDLGFDSLKAWDHDETGDGMAGWTPEDLLILLHMWQRGDVSVCIESSKGDLDSALAKIAPQMLIMPCKTDQYFLPDASEREVKSLKHGTLRVIPSIWGHIAGGGANPEDTKYMHDEISKFLGA
ncbi:homoserine acetyltransferase family protein [Myriangium duriaei CBS 260.36]|uniref:Homoserine acetyltransferase family protein n=1 Tax=Myriangium duriaei CBS 260.36 TaxID=1168546 RepID=A0A9P4J9Z0_9PEZI|nr:homoserine acetyltransferase family protein [Myriangium duriaei CBS 260.36]